MRNWAILLLALAALLASAEEACADGGWEEAVLSVHDLDAVQSFLTEAGGYTVLHQGQIDSTRLAYWGLPPGAAAREVVLGDTGEDGGRIRLMEFSGVAQRPVRRWSQPWDTGGWFSLSFWVDDLASAAELAQRHHWQGWSDPVRSFAPDGTPSLWLMLRNADGVVVSVFQPLIGRTAAGTRNGRGLSAPFAATAVVADLAASADFHAAGLGVETGAGDARRDRAPSSAFGLPGNLGDQAARHVLGMHARGQRQLQLTQWAELRGRDFAEHARAPNLGILALTYRVTSVAALRERFEQRGLEPEAGPVSVVLPPYGIVNVLRLRSPDGALTEYFSVRP